MYSSMATGPEYSPYGNWETPPCDGEAEEKVLYRLQGVSTHNPSAVGTKWYTLFNKKTGIKKSKYAHTSVRLTSKFYQLI
jgi:hypothetical protein